ncbi:midline fasciclin isoform 1-T1 [Glossina fuscipes fuscipes]
MAANGVILLLTLTLFSVSSINTQYYSDFMDHALMSPFQQQQLPPPQSYPPILTRYFARTAPYALQPQLQVPQQQLQQQYSLTWPQRSNNNIFNSYEPEAEFVPLEEQQRHQQNNQQTGRHNEEKPFDVEVVSGDINGGSSHLPGLFFHQAFPFLGNSFFNSFGGFGIGTQQEPWWKGPNVCTEKEEDEKVMDENDGNEETETADGTDTTVQVKQPYFGQFHFSMNSCVEKPSKYICKRVVNKNGRKKTLTITRQCCHGYGRPRNAAYATPCDKIEIKDVESTAADVGAKDFVIKAKNSGLNDMIMSRKNLTMFLPVDEAFSSYSDLLQSESNLVEKQNDDGMKKLFLRHVVDGEVSMDEVRNEQLFKTQVGGQNIRINSYQVPLSLSPEPYRYTANCVPILKHDKSTEQGMIHTLDGIMKPVNKNLMDIIRDRRDMSIMRTVLEKTKLSDLLEGEKPLTIFVPTDDAFDKLESHLRRVLKEGKGCASNILKNHMLDLTFCSIASVPGAKTTAYNLLGEPMRFNRSTHGGEIEQPQPIVINGVAKVVETDIMGTNGVVHVIDTIMPTETALPLSSLMQEKNVTIFRRLLEISGLDNAFDDMDNLTMFAPTDKALEGTEWAKMLEENPEQLINNRNLNEFLSYHVTKPMTKTCDLKEQLMPTIGGGNVRINLFSTHSLFTNVMNRATANCARLVHFDDESCGSVLHQVDKPLIPPKMNLLEMLQNNPNYSKFLELVQAANLTNLLVNPEEDYTLLVPKNDVFEELDENVTKEPTELESLIKTHIVNDVICCAGIIPTNWPFVRSIESLNGHHLRITRDRRPKIQNAGITKCDAMATNGIIHEMNDIVVPSSRQSQQPQRPHQHFSHHPQEDIFSDLFF